MNFSAAHIWDGSAVAAIDRVVLRYRRKGVGVTPSGVDEKSATLLERLATHDKADALNQVALH